MPPLSFPRETIDAVIRFHGHACPGLAIGVRAAELALQTLNNPRDTDLVCVAETDMCACDAIQVLTGCTFGKGNFIHRDLGKIAFSFWDKRDGRGIRLVLRRERRPPGLSELRILAEKITGGTATIEEQERFERLRRDGFERYLEGDAAQYFRCQNLDRPPPRPARILESVPCAACGEEVMETRARRFQGEFLCIPCFEAREQKV